VAICHPGDKQLSRNERNQLLEFLGGLLDVQEAPTSGTRGSDRSGAIPIVGHHRLQPFTMAAAVGQSCSHTPSLLCEALAEDITRL